MSERGQGETPVRLRMRTVLMGAGAALAFAGVASGQEVSERQAAERETPWFERFTSSTAPAGALGARIVAPETPGTARLDTEEKWGISVNVREDRVARAAEPREEAQVSAFFQFTPRLRVAGRLSLSEQPRIGGEAPEQASAVKIESAFKF